MLSSAGIFIHKISFTHILKRRGDEEFAENKKHSLINVPTDPNFGLVDDMTRPSKLHTPLSNGKLGFISNQLY